MYNLCSPLQTPNLLDTSGPRYTPGSPTSAASRVRTVCSSWIRSSERGSSNSSLTRRIARKLLRTIRSPLVVGCRPRCSISFASLLVVAAPSRMLDIIASSISELKTYRSRWPGPTASSERSIWPLASRSILWSRSVAGSGSVYRRGRPRPSANGRSHRSGPLASLVPSHHSSWLRPAGAGCLRSSSQGRYLPPGVGPSAFS